MFMNVHLVVGKDTTMKTEKDEDFESTSGFKSVDGESRDLIFSP